MGKLQDFMSSTGGQITVIVVILVLFLIILISGKKKEGSATKKVDVKALAVSALLVALATALGYITIWRMPQGGSITAFSMVPIVLAGYLMGTRRGVMVGMCVGLLNLLFNPYVIHPVQMLLDYPIAFGALALGAFLRNKGKFSIIGCFWVGVLGRYICAVISGIVFFGSYAPEGFNAFTWSVYYNMTYLAVEGIVTTVILCIPQVRNTFEKLRFEY